MIRFWTDGSGIFDENGRQPTGYACVGRIGEYVVEIAGWSPFGTNNTAELSAAIMALGSINPDYAGPVEIYTDSMYVLNQALGKWKVNTNHALVAQLQALQNQRQARWFHVRGHQGDWGNERADVLAGEARKAAPQATAYFTHVRIYHQSDPGTFLLDKATKPNAAVRLGGESCVLRLLI